MIMLNDILYNLHDATDEEADAMFDEHPIRHITIPEGPFERLRERASYPHEAPQWIPSTSREDIRNRIQYHKSIQRKCDHIWATTTTTTSRT